MVKFIIVRHGLSVTNKAKTFTGQMDVPLDAAGESQAQDVSKYIAENYKVDSIYSSDLCRAVNTIKPLADLLKMEIKTMPELREVDVGGWSGMLIEDVKTKYREEFESYRQNPGVFCFPDGERYIDVTKRAKFAFEKIAKENDGKTVVVATHGGIVRTMRAVWTGKSYEEMKDIPHVQNASVTVALYDEGKVSFEKIGYCDYLIDKVTELGVN